MNNFTEPDWTTMNKTGSNNDAQDLDAVDRDLAAAADQMYANYDNFSWTVNGLLTCLVTALGAIGNVYCIFLMTFRYVAWITHPLMPMTMTSSIWTVVMITSERHMAIWKPFSMRAGDKLRRAKLICALVALFSVLINLPKIFEMQLVHCPGADWELQPTALRMSAMYNGIYRIGVYSIAVTVVPFFSLIILTFRMIYLVRKAQEEYSLVLTTRNAKQRRKNEIVISKMLLSITVKFLMCYTLPTVINVWETMMYIRDQEFKPKISFYYAVDISNFLVNLTSATNCLVYLRFHYKKEKVKKVKYGQGSLLSRGTSKLSQYFTFKSGANNRNNDNNNNRQTFAGESSFSTRTHRQSYGGGNNGNNGSIYWNPQNHQQQNISSSISSSSNHQQDYHQQSTGRGNGIVGENGIVLVGAPGGGPSACGETAFGADAHFTPFQSRALRKSWPQLKQLNIGLKIIQKLLLMDMNPGADSSTNNSSSVWEGYFEQIPLRTLPNGMLAKKRVSLHITGSLTLSTSTPFRLNEITEQDDHDDRRKSGSSGPNSATEASSDRGDERRGPTYPPIHHQQRRRPSVQFIDIKSISKSPSPPAAPDHQPTTTKLKFRPTTCESLSSTSPLLTTAETRQIVGPKRENEAAGTADCEQSTSSSQPPSPSPPPPKKRQPEQQQQEQKKLRSFLQEAHAIDQLLETVVFAAGHPDREAICADRLQTVAAVHARRGILLRNAHWIAFKQVLLDSVILQDFSCGTADGEIKNRSCGISSVWNKLACFVIAKMKTGQLMGI